MPSFTSIESLLESPAPGTEFALGDILDLSELQDLQDAFATANQVAATICDLEGEPITKPSNHCRVCRIIRTLPEGLARCKDSGRRLGRRSRQSMSPSLHRCHAIGFADAAAPIIVGGRHLANWLIGQTCVLQVDEARVREFAGEIGAEAREMVAAFRAMPKIPREEFEKKLDFLWRMANQISRLGFHNLQLQRAVDRLRRSREQLRSYQDHLEDLVAERTRELEGALEEIKRLSHTDALTGCFNRAHLAERLPQELERCRRYRRGLAILLCDLDHFKRVNDTHGHQCGDQVLIQCVGRLQNGVRRPVDWVARYGGEEFLVVMPETGHREAARAAERLRRAIADTPLAYGDLSLPLTASFGVCGVSPEELEPTITADRLLDSADTYLYQAKEAGRNRVVSGPLRRPARQD